VLLSESLQLPGAQSIQGSARWDVAPHDERLFWRVVYLVEAEAEDSPSLREAMYRIVESLARTSSAEITHELLPMLLDQSRLCTVVTKHREGIISRTSFLSVLAECGYPDHIKLWLQSASHDTLGRLCDQLTSYEYDLVAASFEAPPA
jgi:hypothetical protein